MMELKTTYNQLTHFPPRPIHIHDRIPLKSPAQKPGLR